jgi:HTH-type transcriptional regulator / antitoxin HigA
MSERKNRQFDVDSLINGLFKPKDSLTDLFQRRIEELKITPTDVLKLLGMGQNTLYGILQSKQQLVNFSNLIKIADFLQLPKERVVELYLAELERNYPTTKIVSPDKVQFIKENFDLAALKKSKFIRSISDYSEIEKKITYYFGLKSIFDYKQPSIEVAFSEGAIKPKNNLSRAFFINAAKSYFEEVDNPFSYDKDLLINYFSEIRWHSSNVEFGLKNVVRDLYKMGVTVTYIPPVSSLQIRGATFSVNNKPCIVLTDYMGFYSTLWFALVHELFHVIFDWDEKIKVNKYHLSDDEDERLAIRENEKEADDFAREYLFSKEKTNKIKRFINNQMYVYDFAKSNHVHPSFIYVYNAWDLKKDEDAWRKARKHSPDFKNSVREMDNPWEEPLSIQSFIKSKKHKIYNS